MAELLYQGHGSLRLTTAAGTVVYIDPFMGDGYDVPADLVLVTHQHYDHRSIDGAEAAKFLQKIKQYIQNPALML